MQKNILKIQSIATIYNIKINEKYSYHLENDNTEN